MSENYKKNINKSSGTVVTRLLHAPPPLATREFTRHHENNPGNRGSVTASSTLHFLAGGEEHRHLQKEKNTQTSRF